VPPAARVLVAALLLALSTAACSQGTDERSGLGEPVADETIDPCALLTAQDIGEVTGWSIEAGVRPTGQERDGRAVCNWETSEMTGLVQVQVLPDAGRATFERERAELELVHGMAPAVDLDVPGADAAYESPGHQLGAVLVGDDVIQVTTFGVTLDDAPHVELVERALGRLS
jgi:hypothetical protein